MQNKNGANAGQEPMLIRTQAPSPSNGVHRRRHGQGCGEKQLYACVVAQADPIKRAPFFPPNRQSPLVEGLSFTTRPNELQR